MQNTDVAVALHKPSSVHGFVRIRLIYLNLKGTERLHIKVLVIKHEPYPKVKLDIANGKH